MFDEFSRITDLPCGVRTSGREGARIRGHLPFSILHPSSFLYL